MIDTDLYLKQKDKTRVIKLKANEIVHVNDSDEKREKYNGSYHEIEIGVFDKKRLVSGIFCYKGELYVYFDNKCYKESALSYRRYFKFTRIKKFKAYHQGKCIQNFNYIYRCFDDDLYCDDFFYRLIEIRKNKVGEKNHLIDTWCAQRQRGASSTYPNEL